jgi:tetratricopeptide (TPR) repeat protein
MADMLRRGWLAGMALSMAALLLGMPVSGRAQRPSPFELEKAGWDAIRANRVQEAADAFRDAIRMQPGNVRLMLGAGLAAHLLGRSEEARQHLVAALQADPRITQASVLLGQILYGSGDLQGAIHVYEQALVHAPSERLLSSRIESWRRELDLHDRFSQKYGDHFTVLFEGPREEALAKRVIDLLESAYWRIGTGLGAYPTGILTVVLYTNEQFRDITQSPDWAAAAFDGRIRVPMRGAFENPKVLERVLAHELTHAIVYSIAPRGVPQWLNEGLAQVFEPEAPTAIPPRAAAPALSSLEKSFEALDTLQARAAYAQSAAAVRALIDQAGPAALLNLLTFVGEGTPFEQAFERAVFVSYSDFQKQMTDAARLVP